MEIETKRLMLKKIKSSDASAIASVGNDKEISYFTYYWPYPLTTNKAKKIITEINNEWEEKKTVILFKIKLKETDETIGVLDIYDIEPLDKKAKIGYWIGRKYWNQGYATEAVNGAISFVYHELKLKKLSADTLVDNVASNKILDKLGFRKIGIMRKDKLVNGKIRDRYLWEIIRK